MIISFRPYNDCSIQTLQSGDITKQAAFSIRWQPDQNQRIHLFNAQSKYRSPCRKCGWPVPRKNLATHACLYPGGEASGQTFTLRVCVWRQSKCTIAQLARRWRIHRYAVLRNCDSGLLPFALRACLRHVQFRSPAEL